MRNKRREQEDEIPKSVLKMKRDKERREEAEKNKNVSNNKKRGRKSKEQIKNEKKEKRKKFRRKTDFSYHPCRFNCIREFLWAYQRIHGSN